MPKRLAAVALLLACALGALAQEPKAPAPPGPRIALVLGGGGARGGAHLGVLEVLEEMRIPVACVAGTSMGALVGGAYAAGVSPEEILDLVRRTDWNAIFEDFAGREAVDIRRKELDDRFFSGLEFGVTPEGIRFREGAVAGEKVKLLFNQLVRADLGERPIERLRLPLAILATDIGTGERVAIRRGNLTSAMRASMSVPGLMAPVVRDGRKLVDGGLTDNLPIEEARGLCNADVVIAINVGSPLYDADEVKGVVTVLGQVVNLLTEQNVARSMAQLRPGDVYIRPNLGDITAGGFTRLLEARVRGRLAAEESREELKRYSLPRPAYAAWQDHLRLADQTPALVIDQITIGPTRFVNPETIRRGIAQREGQPLDTNALGRDLLREYNHGDLHSLDYSVVQERDRNILRITPVEKPWGPNYLRFGLNFASDFRNDATFNIRAILRNTWMNSLGGEWLVGGQLGAEQIMSTEFYQPLDKRHRTFVRAYASTQSSKLPFFFQGERIAIFRASRNALGVEGGMNFGVHSRASVGWSERRFGSVLDTGISGVVPNLTERPGGVTASLAVDTYDQPFFPTRGVKLDIDHFEGVHVSGDEAGKYSRIEGRFGAAYTLGDWVLLAGLEGGTTPKGSIPLGDSFTLGGPLRLAGFATDQLRGDAYALGRLEAQYRLNFTSPLFGWAAIGGAKFEMGRVRGPLSELSLTGWQRSLGAYLAASTPIGPVYLGVAEAKGGKGRFFLFLGTP